MFRIFLGLINQNKKLVKDYNDNDDGELILVEHVTCSI